MEENFEAEKITSGKAPGVVGPYSQAVKFGNFVFCSGQIGINPDGGELVGEEISEQTKQVMKNLEQVLISSGSGLSKVLQTTIYITDMSKYAEVNSVYAEFFKSEPLPARATVEVSKLPKNALVEISCIAYI